MAVLPSAGSENTIGVLITTVADDGALKTTTAELQVLGDEAKKSGASAISASSNFDTFNSGLKSFGSQAQAVGRSLSTYVTAPIVGIGYEAVKMAMTFQQSMELLHTNASIPQDEIKSLGNSILNLAAQVGQTPNDLAQAFYHIATAGQGIFSTSQMLDQLKVAAQGAAVGQANLDDTTYALTSTLAANVKGATDYNQTMGTLLGIVQAGDMHLQDLNDVIGTGLMGTLSVFGVSLRSAGAALADFGDLGERGAVAGTRLRMMLTLMASPSAAAAKILGDLGLTTNEVSTATGTMNQVFAETGLSTTKLADDLRQPNGISVAIQDLQQHLEAAGLSASQTDTVLAKAFGGGRTDAALLQLLDTTSRLDIKYQQIGTDSGNFASNWQSQQQTMKQEWDEAWGGIEADMIRLGEAIMPDVSKAMKGVAHDVSDLSNWFQHLSSGQKQFVIDAAGVAAAVGPVLFIFGSFAKSINEILTLSKTFGGAAMAIAKGIGLIDTASAAGGAASGVAGDAGKVGLIARLLGGVGGLTEAGEGETMLAGFASLIGGPVTLGILGAAAATGIGYAAFKKYTDQQKAMQNAVLGVSNAQDIQNASATNLNAAQEYLSKSQQAVTTLTEQQGEATATVTETQYDLDRANRLVATDTQAVITAYNKYGANSPQYVKAVENLTGAESKQKSAQEAATKAKNQDNAISEKLKVAQNDLAKAKLNEALASDKVYQEHNKEVKAKQEVDKWTLQLDSDQKNLNIAVKLFGPNSDKARQAANKLAQDLPKLQGAQSVLDGITKTLKGDLIDEGNAIDALDKKAEKSGWGTSTGKGNVKMVQQGSGGTLTYTSTFASGTVSAPGGMAIVGESGPEAMYVPQGSQIFTNSQTRSMLSSGSGLTSAGGSNGGIVLNQENNIYNQVDMTEANRELAFKLATAVGS